MSKVLIEVRTADTVRAWDRKILLSREDDNGETTGYAVILHWDDEYGFSATWMDSELRFIITPEWAEPLEETLIKLDAAKQGEVWV